MPVDYMIQQIRLRLVYIVGSNQLPITYNTISNQKHKNQKQKYYPKGVLSGKILLLVIPVVVFEVKWQSFITKFFAKGMPKLHLNSTEPTQSTNCLTACITYERYYRVLPLQRTACQVLIMIVIIELKLAGTTQKLIIIN